MTPDTQTDPQAQSAPKHTPGPWMILPGEQIVWTKLNDGCRGLPIAKLDQLLPEWPANGSLIADAPRLAAENAALRKERDAALSKLDYYVKAFDAMKETAEATQKDNDAMRAALEAYKAARAHIGKVYACDCDPKKWGRNHDSQCKAEVLAEFDCILEEAEAARRALGKGES